MDLFDPGNVFLWRAVERLIALLIGACAIYLGYRLFSSMRELKSDGEGKVELPGGVSIYVSRVPSTMVSIVYPCLPSLRVKRFSEPAMSKNNR